MRKYSNISSIKIGTLIRRDHSTILSSIKSAQDLFRFDATFRDNLSFIISDIEINFKRESEAYPDESLEDLTLGGME